MREAKPIRVFWSELSQRFYASRAYKQINPGVVEITGQKFDVTDDIAQMVIKHNIQFEKGRQCHTEKGLNRLHRRDFIVCSALQRYLSSASSKKP